jgi:putative PIN family toxin of toxin-antitoxin system
MRIILDTNVLLSAMLGSQGAPAKLLEVWERGLFTLVCCDEIVAELLDVSARPFFRKKLSTSSAELIAKNLRELSTYFHNLPAAPSAPDPKDSFLLALAEISEAEFLVTGDKELLSLKRHKLTRLIAPAAMIQILEAQTGE